jgi:Holliday junction resolvase RusA-like endonuclease
MLNTSFNTYPNVIDAQIRQVMRENYNSFEKEAVEKCNEEINRTFRPKFNREISRLQTETNKQDMVNLLTTLKDAYSQAGLVQDSKVLEAQIRKLDVEA